MRSLFLSLALLLGLLQCGVLAKTAGCGKAATITSGTKTITSGGQSRQYIIALPNNYNQNTAYKLIFGFHWVGGTAQDVATGQTVNRDTWQYYGLKRLANESAIFVAPQGIGNGWSNSGNADINFVDDMIKAFSAGLCIDEKQVYATGFSFGASMTYALACARPTVFKAVAVIAGGVLSGCTDGSKPVPYLGIHGIRDPVLNIAGGRSMKDRFVKNNGCAAKTAPEPANGSKQHIKTVYSCNAGYPVWWIAHDGNHDASPCDNTADSLPAADKGKCTWAPGETWSFFTGI